MAFKRLFDDILKSRKFFLSNSSLFIFGTWKGKFKPLSSAMEKTAFHKTHNILKCNLLILSTLCSANKQKVCQGKFCQYWLDFFFYKYVSPKMKNRIKFSDPMYEAVYLAH